MSDFHDNCFFYILAFLFSILATYARLLSRYFIFYQIRINKELAVEAFSNKIWQS